MCGGLSLSPVPADEPADPPDQPLDGWDPRFESIDPPDTVGRPRQLVRSRGPGPDPEDPQVRRLRVALPVVFFAAVAVVVAVFFAGLRPGRQYEVIGREAAVAAVVEERPKRVCLNGNNPCAWITSIDGELVAFNTNGPLPQEYGRDGIGWCASSGRFGANATGSRFDAAGRVVGGPAPRGLDRFRLTVDNGRVVVDFTELTAGLQAQHVTDVVPPRGPECTTIEFDRNADLVLPGG